MSVRSLSDSDASSDFDDSHSSSSSDDFESPSATPRSEGEEMTKATPDTTPEQVSHQLMMRPKVPILGLRQDLNSISPGLPEATPRKEGQPGTARGRPSIPGLAFRQVPEARNVPSLPPMAPSSSRGGKSRDQLSARATPRSQADAVVNVSLISQGLSLLRDKVEGSIAADTALSQISRQLGIRQAELKLYQLREVDGPCSLAPEAGQYAVTVNNSRECCFSVPFYALDTPVYGMLRQ